MVEFKGVPIANGNQRLVCSGLLDNPGKRYQTVRHDIRGVFQEIDPLPLFPWLEERHLSVRRSGKSWNFGRVELDVAIVPRRPKPNNGVFVFFTEPFSESLPIGIAAVITVVGGVKPFS